MSEHRLWYRQPASAWTEALPLGNGRLGAMVWGGPDEVVSLNEGSLWSGYPDPWFNDGARDKLARVRSLLREGRQPEAQHLVESGMAGRWTQAYLPLGRLRCRCLAPLSIEDYRRSLDLGTATVEVSAGRGEEAWSRQAFVSAPAQVLVYRSRCQRPQDWKIDLESDLRGGVDAEADGLSWSGVAPRFVAPHYFACDDPVQYGDTPETSGMRATLRCQVQANGEVAAGAGGLVVRRATEITLLVAAATSYQDRRTHPRFGPDERALVAQTLARAQGLSFERLHEDHVADHRRLYERAALELGPERPPGDARPTDERLREAGNEPSDPGLLALAFHYGRYLLIAASRPGGQPAPLQGLWNQDLRPLWSANYTVNINTEMNYWPVEVANLSECHEPLLNFIADVAEAGQEVAARHYGARGWTAHHNLDVWAHPIPAGDHGGWFPGSACHLFWPLGGAWLAHHLWEHYQFTQDHAFLRRVWPILAQAARFCLDWLQETPEGGLTTSPSTSPENRYLDASGRSCSVDVGTTSDIASLRELFTQVLAAADLVLPHDPSDESASLVRDVRTALDRLPAYRIAANGTLAEWSQDFEEEEPGHRHFSHLYGLFPGTQLGASTPALAAAASRSLERRLAHGGGGTGWSLAWLVCLQARLFDGNGAHASLRRWLAQSVFDNLFDLHPTVEGQPGVFQLDGNAGVTAAIAELLVQSHGTVHLLPALPSAWPSGRVKGLRVRGGGTVSLTWAGGALVSAELVSDGDRRWTLRYNDRTLTRALKAGESVIVSESDPL